MCVDLCVCVRDDVAMEQPPGLFVCVPEYVEPKPAFRGGTPVASYPRVPLNLPPLTPPIRHVLHANQTSVF
jgi:hypothetical protein